MIPGLLREFWAWCTTSPQWVAGVIMGAVGQFILYETLCLFVLGRRRTRKARDNGDS